MLVIFPVLPVCAQDTVENLAAERELEAGEDPLNKQQTEQLDTKVDEDPFDYALYGSIRGRYRHVNGDKSV